MWLHDFPVTLTSTHLGQLLLLLSVIDCTVVELSVDKGLRPSKWWRLKARPTFLMQMIYHKLTQLYNSCIFVRLLKTSVHCSIPGFVFSICILKSQSSLYLSTTKKWWRKKISRIFHQTRLRDDPTKTHQGITGFTSPSPQGTSLDLIRSMAWLSWAVNLSSCTWIHQLSDIGCAVRYLTMYLAS